MLAIALGNRANPLRSRLCPLPLLYAIKTRIACATGVVEWMRIRGWGLDLYTDQPGSLSSTSTNITFPHLILLLD
jgi:hypothetical protein